MPVMKTLTINGRTYTVTPVVPTDSVTLLASAWEGEDHKYSQVVELSGVTPHTKVDLQPTSEQLVEFHHKVLGFVAENDGGVVVVYSIGDKPTNDHTIQVTMTEVDATGKVRGNTVGTTMPQSDWSQTDPTKADYIKNKPDSLGSTDGFTSVKELRFQDHTGDCKLYAYWEEEITDENGMPTGQVLTFYGDECDESVVLRGIHDPVMSQDAATKRYVDHKVAEVGNGSGQNVTLTAAQINALDGMFKVCTFVKDDVSAEYAAFQTAFGITDSGDSGEDSGGEEAGASNEITWTDGVKYTYSAVDGEYVETDGTITPYESWSRTPYLYCSGASTLRVVVQLTSAQFVSNTRYNAFYDGEKNFIKSFNYNELDGNTEGAYVDVEIPDNAVYFIASSKRNIISTTDNSYGQAYAGFVPYA